MDSKRVCRLCFDFSEDLVDIFEDFEDSTIAEILGQHFWFQICKDDGFSDCLCQDCWTNTKTFHNFYKKVQSLQKNYLKSFSVIEQDSCDPDESVYDEINNKSTDDEIKMERNVSPMEVAGETTECIVKNEEMETSMQLIDLRIQAQEDSNDNDDNYDPSDSIDSEDTSSSNEEESAKMKGKHDTLSGTNKLENVKASRQHLNVQRKNRSKRDTTTEDAQIREFFNMECEICCDQFETFVKAKNHYRIVHNTAGYLTCCDKKFLRRGRVLDHIHRHLNPDAYRCDPCGKNFADKFALKNHIENHEPFDSRAFKCNLCSSSFTKPSKLAQHERLRHCAEEDKKFHCDKCNKNFVSKSVLASHIRGVHEFAFAHVCDICARVFKSKHVFQNHMLEHSTTIRPKMQCNVCGAWLKHEESLRKHLKRHQDTFANCPICNKVLQNKHSLGNHIRSVHGERSHQCTMCDKAFKKAIVLKEHMALHTGEDLYKCPYCIKTFKSGANMHAHRKKAHFTEWTRDRMKRFTPMPVE